MNSIKYLLISNSLDFATDYICYELESRKEKYLRINRDHFADYKIKVDPVNVMLTVEIDRQKFIVEQGTLKAVCYRAPVFLRENCKGILSLQEQLYRSQWSSFIRNLIIFEDVIWMNNPVNTYKAENKALQLKYANEIGFKLPKTLITNSGQVDIIESNDYIVKSLDTALFFTNDTEMFVYSNVVKGSEIKQSDLRDAPVILQEYIYPKIDLRVTVVSNRVYAVKIIKNGNGIDGDWRKLKDDVEFIPYQLPERIKKMCVLLLKKFKLLFGAIDLAYIEDEYYFIEINPTGEWAWLVDTAGQPIYKDIADVLIEGE